MNWIRKLCLIVFLVNPKHISWINLLFLHLKPGQLYACILHFNRVWPYLKSTAYLLQRNTISSQAILMWNCFHSGNIIIKRLPYGIAGLFLLKHNTCLLKKRWSGIKTRSVSLTGFSFGYLDVDFYVDARALTKKEQKMISDFIKADKQKRNHSKIKKGTYA